MLKERENRPYISVTGVTNLQEANVLAETFSRCLPPSFTHQGAVGYLVTLRTLYPDVLQLPTLLAQTGNIVLNTIHYSTRTSEGLSGQVKKLFGLGNIYHDKLCQALQLNVRWPDVNQVEEIKTALPELRIILPLSPWILRRQTREEIADRVGDYGDLLDFILIDPSGGKGTTFEASWVAPYYRLLKYYFPEKQIIVAGGFNEANVPLRLALITRALMSGEFGIDAESGLRDRSTGDHYGKLSLTKAVRYIEAAVAFFSPTSDPPC